jgi:hypothetical protein
MRPAALFATGAVTFGAAQSLWSLGHAQGLWRGTWMLKTFGGAGACVVLFVVVSAIACATPERGRSLADRIAALVAGAASAVAVAIFFVGPGSLWPLVIGLDTVVIALAVGLGAMLSRFVPGQRERPEASSGADPGGNA